MKPSLLLQLKPYYYTPTKALSYDPFFVICMGGRGIGKTTGWEIYCMNNYITRNEQFIYLRRYSNEISAYIATDSITKLYNGLGIQGLSGNGYKLINEKKNVGYVMPLTKVDKFKSTRFDNVTTIVFDEAVIHQTKERRYIKDEVIELLNFISTVQRTRTNLRVILICNNNDMFNPYFSYFKIPYFTGNYLYVKKRRLLIEKSPINPELLAIEKGTPLYALTEGTKFAEFHYNNEVLGMRDFNIVEAPTNPVPYFGFKVEDSTIYIYTYIDKSGNLKWHCSTTKLGDFNTDLIYPICIKGEINYFYGKMFKDRFNAKLKQWYSTNRMTFNDQRAGDLLLWIFENVG